MHETKINFIPLSAACRFCICMAESGQAELFSGQDQWPVLLMLLGAAFVYQGKRSRHTPFFYRFASLRDRFTLFCQAEMGMVAG